MSSSHAHNTHSSRHHVPGHRYFLSIWYIFHLHLHGDGVLHERGYNTSSIAFASWSFRCRRARAPAYTAPSGYLGGLYLMTGPFFSFFTYISGVYMDLQDFSHHHRKGIDGWRVSLYSVRRRMSSLHDVALFDDLMGVGNEWTSMS
jgi:hypothetical protein